MFSPYTVVASDRAKRSQCFINLSFFGLLGMKPTKKSSLGYKLRFQTNGPYTYKKKDVHLTVREMQVKLPCNSTSTCQIGRDPSLISYPVIKL